ncbi:hypothetical protein [Kitasatospora sp. NPDC089509]|uniref:hypothetical protein n=1 Tax=Kitasatospora sp. NPDC089509 TaxID=3364079 RepID=UPI00381AE477
MDVVARVVITWMATWAVLLVAPFLLALVLPGWWQDHDRSRALWLLWLLAAFVGPVVTCVLNRRWIRTGVWRAGAGPGRR